MLIRCLICLVVWQSTSRISDYMDRSLHCLLFLDGLSKYKELKDKCFYMNNAKSKILKPTDDNFDQIVCTSHISCNESVRAFVAKVTDYFTDFYSDNGI